MAMADLRQSWASGDLFPPTSSAAARVDREVLSEQITDILARMPESARSDVGPASLALPDSSDFYWMGIVNVAIASSAPPNVLARLVESTTARATNALRQLIDHWKVADGSSLERWWREVVARDPAVVPAQVLRVAVSLMLDSEPQELARLLDAPGTRDVAIAWALRQTDDSAIAAWSEAPSEEVIGWMLRGIGGLAHDGQRRLCTASRSWPSSEQRKFWERVVAVVGRSRAHAEGPHDLLFDAWNALAR